MPAIKPSFNVCLACWSDSSVNMDFRFNGRFIPAAELGKWWWGKPDEVGELGKVGEVYKINFTCPAFDPCAMQDTAPVPVDCPYLFQHMEAADNA